MQTVMEKTTGAEPETATQDFGFDYKAAARDALIWFSRNVNKKVELELENERVHDHFNAF